MMHVLDLTSWNDAPERMQHEVVDLLGAARRASLRDADRLRASAIC